MSWKKEDSVSQKNLQEIQEAFELFDRDGNGRICVGELGTVLRALGWNPTEKELKDIFKRFDSDKTNTVDFEEFTRLYHSNFRSRDEEASKIRDAFKVFDQDGNGYITISELTYVMSNVDNSESPMTEDEIRAVIAEADIDRDGKINYEEFSQYLCGN